MPQHVFASHTTCVAFFAWILPTNLFSCHRLYMKCFDSLPYAALPLQPSFSNKQHYNVTGGILKSEVLSKIANILIQHF